MTGRNFLIQSLVALGVFAGSSSALAQSNFGTMQLSRGFTPDPMVASGTSGGAMAASNMNSSCTGWISSTPDHILAMNTAFPFLRVFAQSDSDTTLVIQGPNGSVWCNDDTYDRNPAIENAFPAGMYKVWIGSYQQGQNASYQLKVTELRTVTPSGSSGSSNNGTVNSGTQTQSAGLAALEIRARRGNFRPVKLRSGFPNDPRLLSGSSGGSVDAQALGGACRGWVARRPDHLLTLQSAFDFFRIFVNSSSDTTLVVLTPTGQWLCNDDTYERNPAVEQNSWAPGKYLVWVGSYQSGEVAPYTIGFTELRDRH